ncbi:MAG: hypothetical protein KJ709_08505 [Nanoarchaeota archaeon]|nr:hypothetical protein [Nanoarchaeota archaeon]
MLDECFSAFGTMTKAIEAFLVFKGAKPVARLGISEKELPRVKRFCEKHKLDLEIADFKVTMDFDGEYSTKGYMVDRSSSMKGHLFVYLSKGKGDAERAKVAEQLQAYNVFGKILGYPECCRKFFVKNKPTEQILSNDYIIPSLQNSRGLEFPFYNNIFGRYFDTTLLSHAPCSFNCNASKKIGKRYFTALKGDSPGIARQVEDVLRSIVIIGDEIILLPKYKGRRKITFPHVLTTKKTTLANQLQKAKAINIIDGRTFMVGDIKYSMPVLIFN